MKTSDNFRSWADWFRNFVERQSPIQWNSFERLPVHLKQVVGDSVRQFQLGESSEARNLKAKVARYVQRGGDPAYQEAMEWFIFEENRHARLLARFMALEDIPKAASHPTDRLFRLARHSVGLRTSITILLSAELIAVPYYQALHDVSASPILTAVCKQILEDEAHHIRFQAKAIRTMLQGRSRLRRSLARLTAMVLLELAIDVVWFNHSRLFGAAGWTFAQLRSAALVQFRWAWDMIATGEESVKDGERQPAELQLRPQEVLWSDAHGI